MIHTTKTASGTSFYHTVVRATPGELRQVLGVPFYSGNDGRDKTNIEWNIQTDSGDIFTVYDWKEYRPLDEHEEVEWHIGGHSKAITDQAAEEIEEALEKIR